jgi:hypothetical protein
MVNEMEQKKNKSPLKNMYPLNSYKIEEEFNYVCEFVFATIKCSVFKEKGYSYFKKGIEEILRCFSQKFLPSRISMKALDSENWIKIKEEFSSSNFYKKWYKSRQKYYPLFLEHIIPIGSLIDRCQKCNSLDEVKNILSELEFTIILKTEDDKITDNGYKSNGRDTLQNAENVYTKCNIKLVKIP